MMNVITPIAAILSVFVAYYFGQKARTTPLRSAAYSKQVDIVDEISQAVDEWESEISNVCSEMQSMDTAETKEEKKKLLAYQRRGGKKVLGAIRTLQRCEIFLPSAIMEKLDEIVSVLMSLNLKVSDLAVQRVSATGTVPDEPSSDNAENIQEVRNATIEELHEEYREACRDFRQTCREEFGIEALSDETKQTVEQLEEAHLPLLNQE